MNERPGWPSLEDVRFFVDQHQRTLGDRLAGLDVYQAHTSDWDCLKSPDMLVCVWNDGYRFGIVQVHLMNLQRFSVEFFHRLTCSASAILSKAERFSGDRLS